MRKFWGPLVGVTIFVVAQDDLFEPSPTTG